MIFRLGPALAAPEGPGHLPADPDRRPHGQGRPADRHAERPAARGDHEGQRPRAGERGRLLPDRRAEQRDRPGRELHGRDVADRADDAALRARPARPRRAPLRARQDQRDPAGASSTRRRRPGASRSPSSRSRTSRSPPSMQRAMARQAEAERERRAKVISAEGEFQASERLKDAAAIMAQEPITVQLRYLQTLLEIGAANNSTIVFPIPIDLLTALSSTTSARRPAESVRLQSSSDSCAAELRALGSSRSSCRVVGDASGCPRARRFVRAL